MKKRVLIVEDDPVISDMYSMKLEIEGFDVNVAENGADAIAFLDAQTPDAVLLDMMMPVMNGFDTLSMIRAYIPTAKNMKIIIFSNLDRTEDRTRALKLGANGYFVKAETTPAMLVSYLNTILSESED